MPRPVHSPQDPAGRGGVHRALTNLCRTDAPAERTPTHRRAVWTSPVSRSTASPTSNALTVLPHPAIRSAYDRLATTRLRFAGPRRTVGRFQKSWLVLYRRIRRSSPIASTQAGNPPPGIFVKYFVVYLAACRAPPSKRSFEIHAAPNAGLLPSTGPGFACKPACGYALSYVLVLIPLLAVITTLMLQEPARSSVLSGLRLCAPTNAQR
jgi:hypothetical protein